MLGVGGKDFKAPLRSSITEEEHSGSGRDHQST